MSIARNLRQGVRKVVLFIPSLQLPSLFPFPTLSFPLPLPHLRSGPLKYSYGPGERCKLHSGVWGRAPAEIEFDAF